MDSRSKGAERGGSQSERRSRSIKGKVIVMSEEATLNETIDIWRLLVEHDQKMKRKEHEASVTS